MFPTAPCFTAQNNVSRRLWRRGSGAGLRTCHRSLAVRTRGRARATGRKRAKANAYGPTAPQAGEATELTTPSALPLPRRTDVTPLRARPLFAATRLRRRKGRGHEAAADQGKSQRKSKEPRGRAPGRLRGANKARGHLAEDRPATSGPRAREDRRPEATAVRRIRSVHRAQRGGMRRRGSWREVNAARPALLWTQVTDDMSVSRGPRARAS